MALWDRVAQFFSMQGVDLGEVRSLSFASIEDQMAAIRSDTQAIRPWRIPTITEALSVPSIQRAVTLISNTGGSLSMQGFRNGLVMDEPPKIIARPDPYCTPQVFYRDSFYNMATRGEAVWWIANRDSDGNASALVVVPLHELDVRDNPDNRLLPSYQWGTITSTRWSPANPRGQFVHVTYLKEPGALRGVGPLQLAQAAISVSVEAQAWAASFYAEGGYPNILIKYAGQLGGGTHSFPESDEDAVEAARSEALRLKQAWTATPNNTPRVVDDRIEDVKQFDPNPQGAQMLEARQYQNGDAARMYGIPGTLLEYNSPGSSLTYQNVTEVFTLFVKACLAPNYLEPIEQAMSDLLTRSTAARFNVKGFERADVKTRWEVYNLASTVVGPDEAAQMARQQEGMEPGDVEYQSVPPAPPTALPVRLPMVASLGEVRCTGIRILRGRAVECGRLLTKTGQVPDRCPRCKKDYTAVA